MEAELDNPIDIEICAKIPSMVEANSKRKKKTQMPTFLKDGQVGKWEILVNTNGDHFKFWALRHYEEGDTRVRWGRIGTTGQEGIFTYDKAIDRQYEKQRKGYRIPSDEEIEKYFRDDVIALWEL